METRVRAREPFFIRLSIHLRYPVSDMLPAEPVDQPYLIGIAGPSGSGKTELSRRLAATLPAEIV